MPIKNGKMTAQERKFAEVYANTLDKAYAATAAGCATPRKGAWAMMTREPVLAEIARIQQDRLTKEVLPLAVDVHLQLLRDERTPAGARVQAVKLAYDRALGAEAANGKAPHEMTGEELARVLESLKLEASNRAKPVIEQRSEGVFT